MRVIGSGSSSNQRVVRVAAVEQLVVGQEHHFEVVRPPRPAPASCRTAAAIASLLQRQRAEHLRLHAGRDALLHASPARRISSPSRAPLAVARTIAAPRASGSPRERARATRCRCVRRTAARSAAAAPSSARCARADRPSSRARARAARSRCSPRRSRSSAIVSADAERHLGQRILELHVGRRVVHGVAAEDQQRLHLAGRHVARQRADVLEAVRARRCPPARRSSACGRAFSSAALIACTSACTAAGWREPASTSERPLLLARSLATDLDPVLRNPVELGRADRAADAAERHAVRGRARQRAPWRTRRSPARQRAGDDRHCCRSRSGTARPRTSGSARRPTTTSSARPRANARPASTCAGLGHQEVGVERHDHLGVLELRLTTSG